MKFLLLPALLCATSLWGQIKLSPQDLLKQAVEFHQQGKLEEAIKDYQLFLDMYPDATAVRSNLGAALIATGRYGPAIDEYKRSLAQKSDPGVRLNLALAYYKANQYVDAATELETVHRDDPNNVQAVTLLADCELRKGENKRVVELLTPLQQANPKDLGVAYILGTALARDGDSARSIDVIQPILNNGDSAEGRLLMGTTRISTKEYAAAVADLKKAIELNPNLPDVYAIYGNALFSMGDLQGGKKAYLSAIEHDHTNFDANIHLGIMYRLDQDYPHAKVYLARAQALRPGDVGARYQNALVSLAEGQVEHTREELEAIVKAAPNFTEAHVSLATVYYRLKRKEDGARERALVEALNQKKQALEPGAKLTDESKANP